MITIKRLLSYILLFFPLLYVVVAVHEYGHVLASLLTGGWATQVVIHPCWYLPGGYTSCGGGISEAEWAGGLLATSLVGALLTFKGEGCSDPHNYWSYGGAIFGGTTVLSLLNWIYVRGAGDWQALFSAHSVLSYSLIIAIIALGLYALSGLFKCLAFIYYLTFH